MLKTYTVYFFEKRDKTEYLSTVDVNASTAKEACRKTKEWFKTKTGRNAFRPTTKISPKTVEIYKYRCEVYLDVI